MWRKKVNRTLAAMSLSVPALIYNFFEKSACRFSLFFKILRNLTSLMSLSNLYIRPILNVRIIMLAEPAFPVCWSSTEDITLMTSSRGTIEMRSIKNHPLIYLIAIYFLSITSTMSFLFS